VWAVRAHATGMRDAQWEQDIRCLVDNDGGRTKPFTTISLFSGGRRCDEEIEMSAWSFGYLGVRAFVTTQCVV
jgi:hypothetical protein